MDTHDDKHRQYMQHRKNAMDALENARFNIGVWESDAKLDEAREQINTAILELFKARITKVAYGKKEKAND